MIRGFVLAITQQKNYYILSKGPFYLVFLWSWRPETIVELDEVI